MPTVIVTPKATNANSYVTVARADTILGERLHTSAWSSAATADKERGVIWATRLLDFMLLWKGAKRTLEQSLRFPRSGLVDEDGDNIDYDTIPVRLEEATAELAFHLLGKDKFKSPEILSLGISRLKVA